jgi:hypothetical protein
MPDLADNNPLKTLTLQDLQSAIGPVGEPDTVGGSTKTDGAAHPYGDDSYGKGTGAALNKLSGGKKYISPGSGQ